MQRSQSTTPLRRLAAVLVGVNALAAAQVTAQIHYVDDDAPPFGNGVSWDTAFRDIQDALDAARNEGRPWAEIHIAQGTYTPDRGSLDRTRSFVLTSAVSLIGGFAGFGAPNPHLFDPVRFVSILSGDLRRNDSPNFGNRSDNSYHVVDHSRSNGANRIEGLTIRGGNANGPPGLDDRAGALISRSSISTTIRLSRCTITDNLATAGAAVAVANGTLRLADCSVVSNRTLTSTAAGISTSGVLDVERTRFAANRSAPGSSVGAAINASGYTTISDSLFDANGAASPVVSIVGEASILRSTLVNNAVGPQGTVRVAAAPYLFVDGCIIRNAAPGDPEIITSAVGTLNVSASDIAGGESSVQAPGATISWDPANIDLEPLFTSPAGPDMDPATWQDNDYSLTAPSPCIDVGSADAIWFPGAATDLLGNPRVVGSRGDCRRRADMGAIEHQSSAPPPAITVFVRADAPPGGDGASWARALPTLTQALTIPGVREIRLAHGVYTPAPTDRRNAFEIQCEVTLLGSFAGAGPTPDARDPLATPTILSGDLLANDDGSPESLADNSYNILRLYSANAVIDGVIIEAGHGPDPLNGGGGSGLLIAGGSVTLSHCTIRDCTVDGGLGASGAVYSYNSNLTIDSCEFLRNRMSGPSYAAAGALFTSEGSLSVSNTTFADNSAHCNTTWAYGGAVVCNSQAARFVNCSFIGNSVSVDDGVAIAGAAFVQTPNLLVVNCGFLNNQAVAGGKAGHAENGAAQLAGDQTLITGCVFAGNTARGASARAGALTVGWTSPRITNTTITANEAISSIPGGSTVGGVYSFASSTTRFENTILWANTDSSGQSLGAQLQSEFGTLSARNCCIQNWSNSIPGVGSFDADPLFRSLDDLRLSQASPCIGAGNANIRPFDDADLDHDNDFTEPLPLDAANLPRVVGVGMDIGAYETQLPNCPADYNADKVLNTNDYFAFLTDFFAGNPRADFNADMSVDVQDFFEFLAAFLRGCH